MNSKKGYVYLICDPENEYYKIGVTRSLVSKRLKKLQTGNPDELHIVSMHESEFPFMIEKMMHNKYSSLKVLNEWFELGDKALDFNKDCEKFEESLISLKDNPFMANILT